MRKQSIVLQLDTFCYEVLSRHLQKEDMTVEKKLEQCLHALIDQLPEMIRREKIRAIADQLEGLKGALTGLLYEAEAYRDETQKDFDDEYDDGNDGLLSHYAAPVDTCHTLEEAANGLGKAVDILEAIVTDLDGLDEE